MKLIEIEIIEYPQSTHKRIIHLNFPNQYILCMSFCRLQEYSESPLSNIKKRYFTIEEMMDTYAETYGNGHFNYDEEWVGFNLPGNIIISFQNDFSGKPMLEKEKYLIEIINRERARRKVIIDNNFCVIGTYRPEDVDHEIAHALYCLHLKYKKLMDDIYCSLTTKQQKGMNRYLSTSGYDRPQFIDEAQAYFSTSDDEDISNRIPKFALPGKRKLQLFRNVFKEWHNETFDKVGGG